MKKVIAIVLSLTLIFVLAACGGGDGQPTETLELKMGTTLPASSVNAAGIDAFAQRVNEETNGRIKIDVYHGAQIGSETEMIEQCMMGGLDFMLSSMGTLGNWFEQCSIEDLPYMWASYDNARNAQDGKFGQYIVDYINSQNSGLHTLGLAELGFRNITANKAITKPEDLKGLKIRVTESPMRLAVFNLYGAQPVSMTIADLYSALQQGTVDAQENPTIVVLANSYYEVQSHLSLTGHFFTSLLLHVNDTLWNEKFTEEEREIIQNAFNDCIKQIREEVDKYEDGAAQQCIDNGMTVVTREEIDTDAFKEAAMPIYEEYFPVFGDELTEIYKAESGWDWN